MFKLNKKSKVASIDFEYSVTPNTLDVGPMFGFVIVNNNCKDSKVNIFNIKDFPNEKTMIQHFFRTLESMDLDYVNVSFLNAFLVALTKRAEVLNVQLKELIDPDNKYPDKSVSIIVNKGNDTDRFATTMAIWNYDYKIELPTNFKFIDMITFYHKQNGSANKPMCYGLNDMAKNELNKEIKYPYTIDDCFNLSNDALMKYCIDNGKLTNEVMESLIGRTNYSNDYTTYYSTKENVPLIYRHTKADKPVITVENANKWYTLYLVNVDGTVEKLKGFDGWIDHCPLPDDLIEFAEENNYYVDATSLELIAGRAVMEKEIIATCGYTSDVIYAWN